MKMDWIILVVMCSSVFHIVHSASGNVLPFFLNLDVCQTKSCRTDAMHLLRSLNQSVSPCDDFYQFACGGWLARNKRPASQSAWSQWEPVMQTVEDQLRDILVATRTPTPNVQPLAMARAMYDACIHIDQHEHENTVELMKVIDKYGGWPMVTDHWSDSHMFHVQVAKINADFNIFPLVKFHVSPNLYNTSQYVLYIDRPALIYPHYMLTNPLAYKTQIKSYVQWIVSSAVEIAGSANQLQPSLGQVKQDALELVDLEVQLARLASAQDTHNITALYKQMSVEQLQLWTDLVSAKNHSIIIWTDIIQILMENNNGVDTIVVQDLVYLLKLIQLVTSTPNRTIANYLAWNIVKYFAKDVSAGLEKHSLVIDKLLYGVDDQVSRQKYCIATVMKQMQLALGHAYIGEYLNEPMKHDIEMLMNNIKTVLIKKLSSLQWLDSKTRQKALEKAKSIRYVAAYPEYLQNRTYIEQYYSALTVSDNHVANVRAWNMFIRRKEFLTLHSPDEHIHDRWFSSVTDVNAYYSVLHNSVILPGALLQRPFYSMKRLKALNYGAIGTIIGHEFSHAFDNTGRQADKDGNIKQWWSRNSLANYENHLRCLESHYSKYMVDIMESSVKTQVIDIRRTQDENIADIIGLNLAYTAYTQVKQHRDVKLKLPGLETYTPDQLFFISFANQWCEVTTREQLVTQLLDAEHTPSQMRVMGALSTSVPFSKAFHCPATSRMNPKHKCPLW